MKKLFAVLVFIVSQVTFASGVEAPGRVTYKMPNNEIVKRELTLRVPSMGQGDVVLIGQSELVADRFFSKEVAGRTVFVVVFSGFPGAEAGQKSVFKGTYLRGSNKALYFGNVFIVNGEDSQKSDAELIEFLNHHGKFVAGFYFSVDI